MPLTLKRYSRRSANWYLRGTVRGQAVFETTGTDDRKAAEAIRIKREAQLLDQSVFGKSATVTFAEAAASYLEAGGEARFLGTYDEVRARWTLILGKLASVPVAAIDQVQVDEVAVALHPNASAATRRRQVYVPIKSVLNHAAEKWKTTLQRIRSPRERKVPVQWATPDHVGKLLQHCPPRLRRFVMVLVYTGERLEKVLELDWDRDIDLGARAITFPTTKNGEMRTVHMHDVLLAELASVPADQRHGRLFHWRHKTAVHAPLKSAAKRAGLPYLSPHKLGRHTHATWLRRYSGRDLRGLMEDVGWKSVNSAIRYAHVVAGESVAAVVRLPGLELPADTTVAPLKDRRVRRRRTA